MKTYARNLSQKFKFQCLLKNNGVKIQVDTENLLLLICELSL